VTSLGEMQDALRPVGDLLAADGYLLGVSATAAAATLTVSAGPDACAECLVPKQVFEAIATKHLRDRGITVDIDVVYPIPTVMDDR
jgi:hypothetical protein